MSCELLSCYCVSEWFMRSWHKFSSFRGSCEPVPDSCSLNCADIVWVILGYQVIREELAVLGARPNLLFGGMGSFVIFEVSGCLVNEISSSWGLAVC